MLEVNFKGYTILVGQNENENDYLVRNSNPNDYWLHLSEVPSPHAVIKNPSQKRIHQKVLKRAAYLVKINSKFKKENKISVDISRIKHLEPTEKVGTVILNEISKQIEV
tara:strand:- start:51 stop:377 length:327 start_codon:yes stop_codon:yes gene_type:complete